MNLQPWNDSFAARWGAAKAHSTDSAPLFARQKALDVFLAQGFPTRSQEEWKYTSLKHLDSLVPKTLENVAPGKAFSADLKQRALAELKHFNLGQSWKIAFCVDGIWETKPLTSLMAPNLTAPEDSGESLSKHAQNWDRWNDSLGALHCAFSKRDLDLKITGSDQQIALIEIRTGQQAVGFAASDVNISLAPAAKATVLLAQLDFSSSSDEIFLGISHWNWTLDRSSHLNLVALQNSLQSTTRVNRTSVDLQKDAQLQFLGATLGTGLTRNDLKISLQEKGSHCTFRSFYGPTEKGVVDNHTEVVHCTGETTSSQNYKGLIFDAAHGIFNGKVRIKPGADGSHAQQSNRNILMGDKALMDTKPELQIDADDVTCSHGAAVGPLSEEELFYLESRGLTRAAAMALVAWGFASELHEEMPLGSVYLSFLEGPLRNFGRTQ